MSGRLIVRNVKKSTGIGENLNIKFLKKKMKKLNNELGSMSNYVFRLRSKIHHNVRNDVQGLTGKKNLWPTFSSLYPIEPKSQKVFS